MENDITPIIAALISAVSAIIVALINYIAILKTRAKSKTQEKKKTKKLFLKRIAERNKRWIIIICVLLVPWIIISTIIIPYFAAFNLIIIIPACTIILSIIWPLKPFTSIITVLGLHSPNLYLGEIFHSYRSLTHSKYQYLEQTYKSWVTSSIPVILLVIIINALVVGTICYWRINAKKRKEIKITENEKKWIMVILILVTWLIFSPLLWGLYGYNLFIIIPMLSLILSMFVPINPFKTLTLVLVLHLLNIFFGMISSTIYFQSSIVLLYFIHLSIMAGNSILAGIICRRHIIMTSSQNKSI